MVSGRPTRLRRVSQADVARQARVSPAIVSSVVNDRDYGRIRVSDATKQRVWDAVRELGYVPNLAARNLARGRNQLLAVFTYERVFPYEGRDFYHEFLIGVEEAAERAGYNLMMITGARTPDGVRSVYAGGVNNLQLADGAVLLGSGERPDELERLTAEDYPFVYIGERRPRGVPLSFVGADYRGGTAEIVTTLAGLGHRRIAMLRAGGDGEPVPGRRPGFLDGCRRAGLTDADRPLFTLADAGDDGARPLPDVASVVATLQREAVSAVLVERADEASAVLAAARRHGLGVPEELTVVSLGVGSEPSDATTIARLDIPRREMGRRSVEMVLDLLATPADRPLQTGLACGFVPAGTVAPPSTPPVSPPPASRH